MFSSVEGLIILGKKGDNILKLLTKTAEAPRLLLSRFLSIFPVYKWHQYAVIWTRFFKCSQRYLAVKNLWGDLSESKRGNILNEKLT